MRRLMWLLASLLIACQPTTSAPSTQETQSMSNLRFLALGDSYTIGERVSEAERWPNQVAQLLVNQRLPVDVTIIARTGWTTSELWSGIQQTPPQPPYDMVSLLIGVNNQYRGGDPDTYRQEFVFLLQKAVEYAGGDPQRVIVLSIPDWGVTPYAGLRDSKKIAREIEQFNAINLEEAQRAGVHYVDVTPVSRQAVSDRDLIAADGLHPSGKMYAEWAKLVLPMAQEILSSETPKP